MVNRAHELALDNAQIRCVRLDAFEETMRRREGYRRERGEVA